MTNTARNVNLNVPDHPFNTAIVEDIGEADSGNRAIAARDKDLIRDQIQRDVDAWLAEGNEIDVADSAINDRNCRRVEVHDSKYFF